MRLDVLDVSSCNRSKKKDFMQIGHAKDEHSSCFLELIPIRVKTWRGKSNEFLQNKNCYHRTFIIETQNLGKAQDFGALPAVEPLGSFLE